MMLDVLRGLVVVSVLIFTIGMIKPKWVVFWLKQPDRLSVTAIAMLLFMGAWTGIAKLTLKPKPQIEQHQERESEHDTRDRDEANQINLNR